MKGKRRKGMSLRWSIQEFFKFSKLNDLILPAYHFHQDITEIRGLLQELQYVENARNTYVTTPN